MRTLLFTIVFVFVGWYAVVSTTTQLVGWLSPGLPLFSQN